MFNLDHFSMRSSRCSLAVLNPALAIPILPAGDRLRNLIERAFCRLKTRRAIATRYGKLATSYVAASSPS